MNNQKMNREKPVEVGICKGCDNPIYQWEEGEIIKLDYHEDGMDYSCRGIKNE